MPLLAGEITVLWYNCLNLCSSLHPPVLLLLCNHVCAIDTEGKSTAMEFIPVQMHIYNMTLHMWRVQKQLKAK